MTDRDVPLEVTLAVAAAVAGAAERTVGLDHTNRRRVRQLSETFARLAERQDIRLGHPRVPPRLLGTCRS